ncbi:MAG: hypothetical protein WKG07_35990 [Hymenobacter sp.]
MPSPARPRLAPARRARVPPDAARVHPADGGGVRCTAHPRLLLLGEAPLMRPDLGPGLRTSWRPACACARPRLRRRRAPGPPDRAAPLWGPASSPNPNVASTVSARARVRPRPAARADPRRSASATSATGPTTIVILSQGRLQANAQAGRRSARDDARPAAQASSRTPTSGLAGACASISGRAGPDARLLGAPPRLGRDAEHHPCTVRDFEALLRREGVRVVRRTLLDERGGSAACRGCGRNLLAAGAVYLLGR